MNYSPLYSLYRLVLGLIVPLIFYSCSDNPVEPEKVCSLKIEILSGNNQKTNSGEYLASPVVFSVKDRSSLPVADKELTITVVTGGGKAESTQLTTNAEGTAETRWRPGFSGDQILKAEVEDDEGLKTSIFAVANSDINFNMAWTSGINFYRNFSEPMDHDGRILETNNFLIFSNAANDNQKAIFAKIAEEHLLDIMNKFELESSAELRINQSDSKSKIKIYAHTNTTQPGTWRGARNYGILFFSYGSKGWLEMGLKHELAHMVELLLIGPENFVGASLPSWFAEGIAEQMSNYTAAYPSPIRSVSQLNSWISNHKNPLTIINFEDIGSANANEYYNMFGVILKFMLDPKGLGKTYMEIKEMYRDIASTHDFKLSFENKMGMSVDSLRENLYSMLQSYFSAP